ncbi:hypothetical protein [Gillisia sp. Hel_I_29]|uniref:hypothetical protein n=1 Tax=Gillisia sp. Hel_I_29 TaxID=1249975 RepID=UPI00055843EE|nr:hypothetical protein [Gillisia sp. Hel_I_29]
MKRVIYITALLVTTAASLTSCRDNVEKETIVREVRVEKAEPVKVEAEEKEGILERTAKKVDGEVNKEIDKRIETIGDDN